MAPRFAAGQLRITFKAKKGDKFERDLTLQAESRPLDAPRWPSRHGGIADQTIWLR